MESISGERTTRRAGYDEIHPFDPHFERKNDEGSHLLSGVFGSVIRPPIFEGVFLMYYLVVFMYFLEYFVVMNN